MTYPGWGSLAGDGFSAPVDPPESSPHLGEWQQQSQMPETDSDLEQILGPLAQYLAQTGFQGNSIAHGGVAVSDSCQIPGVQWNSNLPPADGNGLLDMDGLNPQAANATTTYPLGPLEAVAVPNYFPAMPQQQHDHQFQQQGFYGFSPNGAAHSMQMNAEEQLPSEGPSQPSRGQTWPAGASVPRYHASPVLTLNSATPGTSATPSPTYPLSTHSFAAPGVYQFVGVSNNVAGAGPSPATTRENSPPMRQQNVEARSFHKQPSNTAATPRRASAAATFGDTINAAASGRTIDTTNGNGNENGNSGLNDTPGHRAKRRKSAPNLKQPKNNNSRSGNDVDDDDDDDETTPSDDAEWARAQARTQGNGNGNGTHTQTQKQTRDRNRAAASRYRAKTQAASAKLEVEERAAQALNRTLHATAATLHDEVYALKNELLRHGNCLDANIQLYFSNEAEKACQVLQSHGRQVQRK